MHVVLVLEILSIVGCLHCLYGERFRLEIKTMTLIMLYMLLMETANYFMIHELALGVYVLVFLYSKVRFKCDVRKAFVNIILYIIILSAMQFVCVIIASIVMKDIEEIRNLMVNALVLLLSIIILPRCKLDKLSNWIKQKDIVLNVSLGVIFTIICIMLIQNMVYKGIDAKIFIFVIPILILLLLVIGKWLFSMEQEKSLEEALQIQQSYQSSNQELITKMRMRQHGFENHITAIMGLHYTHKTYEELVKSQTKYCNDLLKHNRYSKLISIGNNLLAGFFYQKFQELEAERITVSYKISVNSFEPDVEVYYIVEMLGILIDNAAEAVVDGERVVKVRVLEQKDCYMFEIYNKSNYITYAEIEKWFQMGKSSKGAHRGIGLYRVKSLCKEIGTEIRGECV